MKITKTAIRKALSDIDFRDSLAMAGAVEIADSNYCRNKVVDLLKTYPHGLGIDDTVYKQCIQLLTLARILHGAEKT